MKPIGIDSYSPQHNGAPGSGPSTACQRPIPKRRADVPASHADDGLDYAKIVVTHLHWREWTVRQARPVEMVADWTPHRENGGTGSTAQSEQSSSPV